MENSVLTHHTNGVGVIALNRPKRLNAINITLLNELNAALTELQASDQVKCIVIHGEGRSFCAGDDLKEQAEVNALGIAAGAAQTAAIQQVTMGIMFGPKPVIGAIEGWAVGAGLSWTLNCDLTVWSNSAQAFFPEIGYGAFPTGGATYLLPAYVGTIRAREIMFSGRKLSAQELLDIGWASHLAPEGQALDRALQIASELTTKPDAAVRWMKRALCETVQGQLLTAMACETAACLEAAKSPETLVRMQQGLKRGNAQ